MSGLQLLQALVSERLSAAAEDIIRAVSSTIADYEAEILRCREEIQQQREVLPGLMPPEPDTNHHHGDQTQLTLLPSDQQQDESDWKSPMEQDDQEPLQTENNCNELLSCQEKEPSVKVISTLPYQENKPYHLRSDDQSTKGGEDPLPSSSAEQEQTKVDDSNIYSSSCSAAGPEDSGEEWGGCVGSWSDGSDSDRQGKKKKMGPRLPTAPKLHPAKKSKSQISCKVCGKGFHATVSLVNHMEVHPKDLCGVCGERFETEEVFNVHVKTHVKAGMCSVCGKCFGGSKSLEMHMRIHTGEKPFSCSECGKSFSCRHNMMRHMRIHTGEKPYVCSVCQKCFNDYSTLKRHLVVHVDKKSTSPNNSPTNDDENIDDMKKNQGPVPRKQLTRVICEVCGKMFHSTVSLVNHAKSHATDLCGVCGLHFESEENLRRHLKSHKSGKVCDVCGKCFDSQKNLEMHMRIHTGEKPFSCSECGKSFSCRHNMMRHMRIHTGEKPYVCSVCQKCFNDNSTLKRHMVVHVHRKSINPNNSPTNENENSDHMKKKRSLVSRKQLTRAKCKVCGKMFHSTVSLVNHAKSHATDLCGVCGLHLESEESLRHHLKTHKSGKVCDVCDKCFDSQKNLEMHMRIHTGEKPFLCSECGKSFTCRHNLIRHIRTHTGEKPYLCNVCGRGFSDHTSMKQHSNTHSGLKPHRCDVCGKGFLRKTYVKIHMKSHKAPK